MINNTFANTYVDSISIINSHAAGAAANSESLQQLQLHADLHLGLVLDGGVLPIRRFTMMGGRKLATLEEKDANRCNGKCLEDLECHAWQFLSMNQTCHLFADDKEKPLDIYQADGNDIRSIVGFMQRQAQVLRPLSTSTTNITASPRSERVLYILHFHNEIIPKGYVRLMNEILPSAWQSYMDLVVIAPRQVNLVANGIQSHQASSLRNPFRSAPAEGFPEAMRGANGIMSLPIVRAKFPGYGGYALMNDDAMFRGWDLRREIWFGDRPWGAFQSMTYTEQNTMERFKQPRYPYGPYKWSWWNYDSGATSKKIGIEKKVGKQLFRTRTYFDAALGALNEMCGESLITEAMSDEAQQEFCTNRTNTTVRPFLKNEKVDSLYVPGNDLGEAMMHAIALFGEHDSFMEISYPMIYTMLVPEEKKLEMPYCDSSLETLNFKPYFRSTKDEGKSLDCPLIHPIKFGFDHCYEYWKQIVEEQCTSCEWKHANQSFWSIINE